ncbi:MAG: flagellar hook-basal body complex protein FliE [Pseudomonadota bacterium]
MTPESTLAAGLYGAAKSGAAAPLPPGMEEKTPGLSFSDALSEAARMLESTLRRGEASATAAAQGNGDVQTLVEALSATELALETAVTMRDKVVEAYQEVLRMPV